MVPTEIWRDINGYEGLYQVSSHGRVRSLDHFAPYKLNGGGLKKVKGKIKALNKIYKDASKSKHKTSEQLQNDYYLNVGLCNGKGNGEGKQKSYEVQVLVAKAFIPNPDNKPQINHKNGIRYDNRVDNLEWVTVRENNTHKNVFLKKGTSKYTGVSWFAHLKKWKAQIGINGKVKILGCFASEEEASMAYKTALEKYGIVNKYAVIAEVA